MSTLSVSLITNDALDQTRLQELDAIFRTHYRLTYRTAYAVTGSATDAEDVVQTIFLRLLRREFPPDLKKSPGAYLYRAAVNVSLNAIRGKKRRTVAMERALLEIPREGEPSESAEEIHRRLYEAVAQLDPGAAHVLILRYAHNYSDAEIAKLMGVSRTTIAVRLYRSRARLRKLMRVSPIDGGKS
jgi:RNA polymerase sigma-70 factor, ECF subfamily